jgi:steroid delta-isomerase-like uncharacterized protein
MGEPRDFGTAGGGGAAVPTVGRPPCKREGEQALEHSRPGSEFDILRRGRNGLTLLAGVLLVGGAIGLFNAVASRAQEVTPATDCPATTPAENKALVVRYFEEVYNGRNLDAVDELLADDFGRDNPARPHENVPGNEDDVERVRAWLTDFPDLVIMIDDVVAEGDRVAVRTTWSGTQEDAPDSWNAPATGRPAEWTTMVFYRVECGQLRENWVAADFLTQLRQLGIITDDELGTIGEPTVATPVPN